MALRNNSEHSFRTLAIQTLETAVRAMALKVMLATKLPRSPEHTAHTVGVSMDVLNIKRAIEWLEAMDEAMCPEVEGMEEEFKAKVEAGVDPVVAVSGIVDELENYTTTLMKREGAK